MLGLGELATPLGTTLVHTPLVGQANPIAHGPWNVNKSKGQMKRARHKDTNGQTLNTDSCNRPGIQSASIMLWQLQCVIRVACFAFLSFLHLRTLYNLRSLYMTV